MSNSQLFSDRVLLLRRKLRLGQEAFAKLLRVSRNYVSMIEQGRDPSQALKDRVQQLEVEYANSGGAPERPIESVLSDRLEEDAPAYGGNARSILAQRRKAKGWSIPAFAKMLGYSDPNTYREIEEGRSNMGEKMIVKASKLLDVPVEHLMQGCDEPPARGIPFGTMGTIPDIGLGLPGGEKHPDFTAPKRVKMVPLISWAQCGAHGAPDDSAYGHEGFMVFDPKDPKAFAIALEGDSMADRYEAGDIAIVYPSFKPRNGDVVIAKLTNDDVMCKLYQGHGDRVILSSYNTVYQPMELKRSDFVFIYPVSGVMKTLRNF